MIQNVKKSEGAGECIRGAHYTNDDGGHFLTEKKWKWVSVWWAAMPWLNIQIQRKTCFWLPEKMS